MPIISDYFVFLGADKADPFFDNLKDHFERGLENKIKKEDKNVDFCNFPSQDVANAQYR